MTATLAMWLAAWPGASRGNNLIRAGLSSGVRDKRISADPVTGVGGFSLSDRLVAG
jgi:hypothetical protein